jgi:CRP/FNR family transcriptional regulator, cyclic AMP receptor protein
MGEISHQSRASRVSIPKSTAAELAELPLFASFTGEELQAAAGLFAVRSYPRGSIVAVEGEHLDTFNFILSGRIKWFWRDEAGRQLDVAINGPGEHFADSTFDGQPVLTSVMALEDLRLASIPMPEFERLLLRHPELAVAYHKRVVARLRRNIEALRTFMMEDVYGRVVKLFLERAVETDGRLVTERLTHAEIGHRIGATREMVGQVLRELARGGYIAADKGRITILRKLPRRR